jgi:hypothetical protein
MRVVMSLTGRVAGLNIGTRNFTRGSVWRSEYRQRDSVWRGRSCFGLGRNTRSGLVRLDPWHLPAALKPGEYLINLTDSFQTLY